MLCRYNNLLDLPNKTDYILKTCQQNVKYYEKCMCAKSVGAQTAFQIF